MEFNFIQNMIYVYFLSFTFSFKSKRYRDKLRTEIKALECLIPVDRSSLHRKLDSQTVFRLVISFLRVKLLFKGRITHINQYTCETTIDLRYSTIAIVSKMKSSKH